MADSATMVDRLMPEAGVARIQRVLGLANADNRWQQLLSLCHQFHVPVPPSSSRLERAAKRTQQEPAPKAADCQVQPGYCLQEDGSAAPLLSEFFPGSTGVLLVDSSEATSHLASHSCRAGAELAMLVLGEPCPAPTSVRVAEPSQLSMPFRNLASLLRAPAGVQAD